MHNFILKNFGYPQGISCLKSESLIYFIVAGIFSPALVRWFYFISLDRVGTSVSLKKADLPLLGAAGLCLTVAWLTMFYALSYGDAIIVTPLANLHPLFVLVLSCCFLGKLEKITGGILLGVCVVLAGVLLITTGQA